MRVMALFSTSFFAKYLRVGEDGPGWGHLCHTDTFLVETCLGGSPSDLVVHTKFHSSLLANMAANGHLGFFPF